MKSNVYILAKLQIVEGCEKATVRWNSVFVLRLIKLLSGKCAKARSLLYSLYSKTECKAPK